MKRVVFFTGLLICIFVQGAWAKRYCSTSDFQACKSCRELEESVDLKQPSTGDYYRGAEWNGLFSAYVLNCPVIAAKLIRAGASPSSGGSSGSMILTVASKWPHNNKKVNDSWAALLFAAGANMEAPLKWREGRSTKAILAEESWYKPDYFDLFMLFQQ
jgi:hypothetical protein